MVSEHETHGLWGRVSGGFTVYGRDDGSVYGWVGQFGKRTVKFRLNIEEHCYIATLLHCYMDAEEGDRGEESSHVRERCASWQSKGRGMNRRGTRAMNHWQYRRGVLVAYGV